MTVVVRSLPESLTGAQYDEVHRRLTDAGRWPLTVWSTTFAPDQEAGSM